MLPSFGVLHARHVWVSQCCNRQSMFGALLGWLPPYTCMGCGAPHSLDPLTFHLQKDNRQMGPVVGSASAR